MRPSRQLLVLALACPGLLVPGLVRGATLSVPQDFSTIGDALSVAVAGDVVEIACGTYLESGLSVPSNVTVRGNAGDPGCVVIDGTASASVMIFQQVTGVSIEGVTLTNGRGASFGGGVFSDNSTVSLTRCSITNNLGDLGGGLFAVHSDLNLTDCIIEGNQAAEDAGLMCFETVLSMEDCLVARNGRGSIGGGLGLFASQATLRRVRFEENESFETGGGVEVWTDASATLIDCEIENNFGAWGGGLYVHSDASVEMFDTVITNNEANLAHASAAGGGVLVASRGVLTALRCTIEGNLGAKGPDGAVYGEANLECCTIDRERWFVEGLLSVDDSSCPVATSRISWGELKSRFE